MRRELHHLRTYLHDVRLGPYLARAGSSSLHEVIAMYQWNTHLSSSFHEVLSFVEVVFRNAVDPALRRWDRTESGVEEWLCSPAEPLSSIIDARRIREIGNQAHRARKRRSPNHPRKNEPISHDDLLANTTFGLWATLLPRKRGGGDPAITRRLWEEALKGAFPYLRNDPHGHATGDRMRRLHALRNRVSHMENLLEVDVSARLRDALQLVNSINPDVHDWLRDSQRVRSVASLRPFP